MEKQSDNMNIKYEDQGYKKPNVIGYRELSEIEILHMNVCKNVAIEVGKVIALLEDQLDTDKRWLAIAKTDLQKGFMAMVRSIAKPETF